MLLSLLLFLFLFFLVFSHAVHFSYWPFHAIWNMIKWWYAVLINQINSDACGKHNMHSLKIVVRLFWCRSVLFCFVHVFFCCVISVLNLCTIFFLLNFCRIKQKSCDNQPQLVVASHSIYSFNWIEIIKRNLFFVSNYGDHIECCCYWHLMLCLFSARCIFQTPPKHDTYIHTHPRTNISFTTKIIRWHWLEHLLFDAYGHCCRTVFMLCISVRQAMSHSRERHVVYVSFDLWIASN